MDPAAGAAPIQVAESASTAGPTLVDEAPASASVEAYRPAEDDGPHTTFLETFLSSLSTQTGEDFMQHADLFREFGMVERHQFQRAHAKPALMEKISKKLEERKVSVWAVTNIEAFLDEYFAEGPRKDADGGASA